MVLMANRYILPAAYRFEGELAQSVAAIKAAGVVSKETSKTLETVSKLTDEAKGRVDKLQHLLEHEANGDIVKHAKYFRDKVDSGDGGATRGRRRPGRHRAARRLAAPDVSRDVVRQVIEVDGRRSAVVVDFSRAQGASLGLFFLEPTRSRHFRPRNVTGGAGMKLRGLMALGSLSCLLALPAAGQSRRVDLEAADCSQMHVQFGDFEVARAVQQGTCPALGRTARRRARGERRRELRERHGRQLFDHGLHCRGRGDTGGGAAGGRQRAPLDRGEPGSRAGRPAGESWNVQLIVGTPPGADVAGATTNGPIGLTGVSGTFNARATNGPIGLSRRPRHRLCACAERADRRRRQRG